MKYSMFLAAAPHDEMVSWVKKYESAGFDSLWQAELTTSALIPLAGIAPNISTIKIGAGVVLAFTHSPVMLAFQALDLDLLSQGKFTLGLGVAHQHRNNNWYAGRDEGKPVSQMREYIEVLQLIMDKAEAGGRGQLRGQVLQYSRAQFLSSYNPEGPSTCAYLCCGGQTSHGCTHRRTRRWLNWESYVFSAACAREYSATA